MNIRDKGAAAGSVTAGLTPVRGVKPTTLLDTTPEVASVERTFTVTATVAPIFALRENRTPQVGGRVSTMMLPTAGSSATFPAPSTQRPFGFTTWLPSRAKRSRFGYVFTATPVPIGPKSSKQEM